MKSKIGALLAMLVFVSVLASNLQAAVLRVVVIKTDNLEAYVKEIERGKALLKQLGSPAVVRVWQARLAGPNAGQVVVSIEYADMVAYANDDTKVMTDPAYVAWLKGLSSIRTVVSDSIYQEAKP